MADLTVSRKIAILAYLDRGASTLGEMATHFHTTPARMRRELSELFVMEIPNAGYFESPVDIAIPDDDDGEVRLIANDTRTSPSLSLAEVLTLMAVLTTTSASSMLLPVPTCFGCVSVLSRRARRRDTALRCGPRHRPMPAR